MRIETATRSLLLAATTLEEVALPHVAAEVRRIAEGLAKPMSSSEPPADASNAKT
jgi:hypothetical protein